MMMTQGAPRESLMTRESAGHRAGACPPTCAEKASAEALRRPVQEILCAGRDETVIRIISRIPPIIPLALQAWIHSPYCLSIKSLFA